MTDTKILICNKDPLRPLKVRSTAIHAGIILAMLLGGGVMSVATAATPPVVAGDNVGTGGEWKTAGGTLRGTRFSYLDQINSQTLSTKGLKEEFSVPTGVSGRFMGEPLVIGSTLYVVTGFPNRLVAYNLGKQGAIKWTYAPDVNEYSKGANCCGGINRGAAYAAAFTDKNGVLQPPRIVFNLLDNTVVAVNANNGSLLWKKNLADPHTGVTMTVAPIIVPKKDPNTASVIGGKVITASSSGEMGVRGWMQALDLQTGALLWRGYNTGPDSDVLINSPVAGYTQPFYAKDQGANRGVDSWPTGPTNDLNRSWLLGGSSAWGYLTYDPDSNLLFYGTSQPGVWNADMRKGSNKWGSSIFARNPDNGEVKWVYQVTENDSWDYDAASENIALDLPLNQNESARRLLVHLNKNGFAYTFDRETGEILNAEQFTHTANWATAEKFDLTKGLQPVLDDMRIHQDKDPKKICPSVLGGKGWEPGAFSPQTKLVYMPTFNFCSTLDALKAEFISGAPYMGASYDISADLGSIGSDGKFYSSELIAWDPIQGKRLWEKKEPAMIYAGVLATAGNVVIYSTQAPSLKAVDATTGKDLWSTSLKCNTVGNPITFQGPDGVQRIAVFSDDACTNGAQQVSDGGQVHVFKLNP